MATQENLCMRKLLASNFAKSFVRNALILNFYDLNWGKLTILFVPIRPCKRDEELEELEETGEQ